MSTERSAADQAVRRWSTLLCMGLLVAMPALLVVGQAAADIALSAVAILFLVRSLLERDWRWLAEPWVVVGLVVWIYLMINAAHVAADPIVANTRAQPFGRFIVFAAALQFWLFQDQALRRRFLIVLAVVLAFVAADCLLQFWTGADLFGRAQERFRLTGPFADTVPGGFLSRLSLPLIAIAFAWSTRGADWRRSATVVAATVTLGITIALTGERAALVMFAFGLGCLFLFLPAARRPLLVTGLAGAVLLTAVVVHNPTVSKRLVEHTTYDLTNFWDRRIGELWLRGVEVWETAPLFGVGLKNFRNICERQDFEPRGRVEDRCYTHPHQLWNEWLAETGAVGLSGFIALIVLWSRLLIRKLRRRDEDYALTLGATIALVIFLWPLRSSMSFFTNWIGAMFWLMLGLALALASARGRPGAASDRRGPPGDKAALHH